MSGLVGTPVTVAVGAESRLPHPLVVPACVTPVGPMLPAWLITSRYTDIEDVLTLLVNLFGPLLLRRLGF